MNIIQGLGPTLKHEPELSNAVAKVGPATLKLSISSGILAISSDGVYHVFDGMFILRTTSFRAPSSKRSAGFVDAIMSDAAAEMSIRGKHIKI